MAKNINHIQHLKSNVVLESGKPKLPTANNLVEGELAINYASGVETISIKNASGDVVPFSSDDYYTEQKLGSGFTGANSGNTVTSVIVQNEKITAAALNDLNEAIDDVLIVVDDKLLSKVDYSTFTGHTESNVHLTNIQRINLNSLSGNIATISGITAQDVENWNNGSSAQEYVDEKLGSAFTGANSGVSVTEYIDETEKVSAAAVADLNAKKLDISTFSAYSGTVDTAISSKASQSDLNTLSGTVTAHTANTSVHMDSTEKTNVDALATNIATISGISATDITNWDNKVSKTDFDDKLGSAFTGANSGVTVTEALSNVQVNADQVLDETTSASTNAVASKAVYSVITDNELVWTNAYVALSGIVSSHTSNTNVHVTPNDADYWDGKIGFAEYDSNSKKIIFYEDDTKASSACVIDATAFVKDGMVSNVEIKDVTSGTSQVTCLVITFNSDSGKQDINIPLTDIFDASNYYTTGQTSGSTELSTAFANKVNNSTFTAHTANTSHMTSTEKENLDSLSGNIATISGISSTDVTNWNNAATSAHSHTNKTYLDGITGNVGTMAYENASSYSSATEVNTALADKSDTAHTHDDRYYTETEIDTKLGSGFTSSSVTEVIESNERVVASCVADLDTNKLAVSAFTAYSGSVETSISNKASQSDLNTLSGTVTAHTASTSLHLTSTEKTNIDSLATNIAAISGVTSTKVNNWDTAYTSAHSHDNMSVISGISASDVTSWNDKLDQSDLDDKLGSAFTGSNSGKTVTSVIEDNEEVVAAALTVLSDEMSDKASKTTDLDGVKIKKITQSDYDALVQAGTVDANTLYFIYD